MDDERRLTAADRCDACGAQAYWLFAFPKTMQQLLFCAHHGKENEQALLRKGAVGFDHRDELNQAVKA